MIKVVIADDQSVIREGLKFILEQDPEIRVAGCASNGMEALYLCERVLPDVVLMDIIMPLCDGIEGTRMIKEKYDSIKVIILTTFKDDANIAKALENGADGYVLKDIDTEGLLLTIKSISKRLRVIQEDIYDSVVKQINANTGINTKDMAQVKASLTERELSIIRLIVYGKSNKEIAAEIFLSEGSVRNAISAILSKLKLKDRTQLAVFSVKNNLV